MPENTLPPPSELLNSGVVSANTMIDKHSPTSPLVRVCENELYQFAKTLIEHGAEVRVHGVTVRGEGTWGHSKVRVHGVTVRGEGTWGHSKVRVHGVTVRGEGAWGHSKR